MTVGIDLLTNLNITEGTDPTVEYCVVISVRDMNTTIQPSDFSVCVSTVDGTAMGEKLDCIFLATMNYDITFALQFYTTLGFTIYLQLVRTIRQ